MRKILFLIFCMPVLCHAGFINISNNGTGSVTMTSGSGALGQIIFSSGIALVSNSSSSLVQSAITANSASTDLSCVLPGPTTANNTIYIAMGLDSSTFTVTTPTDSCGDTFTEAPNSPVTGTGIRIRVFIANTNGTGCATITATSGTPGNSTISCAEYSNIPASSPIDCDTGGTGNSTNLLTNTPTCTTTHAGDTLIAFGYQPVSNATFTAGSLYTIQRQNGGTGHSGVFEDQHVSTTGTYTGSTTSDKSTQWAIHMMAIKAAP